ncbi:EpsG family protein [Pseudoxanthomonas koreensis]|uniref:EpsG family protein n=1 Tax=Pseudoxanthomonas koreensis TaxID=266061 RepID=UPI0035A669F3
MAMYWLLFLVPVTAMLVPGRLPRRAATLAWWMVGALFAIVAGLRHEVGGDWYNYLRHFEDSGTYGLLYTLQRGDPGYYALNWAVSRLGGSVHHVNLVCAAIMMWGTVVFCRRQPRPWLALLVAVPYMVIVVGMGYSRQAVALGFALVGLVALGDRRIWMFVAWIAMGALFHKSAVLLLPIAALAASRNRIRSFLLVGVIGGLLYYLLLADASEALWENYVESQYHSEGGLVRVLMNVLPALVMLVWGKKLVPDPAERRLWHLVALMAVACLPLVGLASTAVDRVALYLIPLQLFVFARVPGLMPAHTGARTFLVFAVMAYYATAQWVWLTRADHAQYWIPYRMAAPW